MRETTPTAMPPCFDKWCKRFDDLLRTKAQKSGATPRRRQTQGNAHQEESSDTIWGDYWEKVSEKTSIRWLLIQ